LTVYSMASGRLTTGVESLGEPLPIGPLAYDDAKVVRGLKCREIARGFMQRRGLADDLVEMMVLMMDHKCTEVEVEAKCMEHGIDADECYAIVWYASDATMVGGAKEKNVWLIANALLRKRDVEGLETDGLIAWLYWLLKGLAKLPRWEGEVYRGLSVPLVQMAPRYVEGREVTGLSLTSTTTDQTTTMRELGSGAGGGTFVQLEVTDARDIAVFSRFAENERLLVPNTTFRVLYAMAHAVTKDMMARMAMMLGGAGVGAEVMERLNLPPNTVVIIMKQVPTPIFGQLLRRRSAGTSGAPGTAAGVRTMMGGRVLSAT
jgi:hypothetical protein